MQKLPEDWLHRKGRRTRGSTALLPGHLHCSPSCLCCELLGGRFSAKHRPHQEPSHELIFKGVFIRFILSGSYRWSNLDSVSVPQDVMGPVVRASQFLESFQGSLGFF